MPRDKPSAPRRPKKTAAPHPGGSRPPCSLCKEPWPYHTGQCPAVS